MITVGDGRPLGHRKIRVRAKVSKNAILTVGLQDHASAALDTAVMDAQNFASRATKASVIK